MLGKVDNGDAATLFPGLRRLTDADIPREVYAQIYTGFDVLALSVRPHECYNQRTSRLDDRPRHHLSSGPDSSLVVDPVIQLSDNLIEKPAVNDSLPPLFLFLFLYVRKMIYKRDTVNLFSDAKLHLVKSA